MKFKIGFSWERCKAARQQCGFKNMLNICCKVKTLEGYSTQLFSVNSDSGSVVSLVTISLNSYKFEFFSVSSTLSNAYW